MKEEKRNKEDWVDSPKLTPKVVFEDRTILVLDKPAGLVVNRAKSVRGETLQDWVEKRFRKKRVKVSSAFIQRSGIVHRLDKETSGLLVVAKTPRAFGQLQKQFKERKVEKRYLALVHGKIGVEKGVIEVPIARNPFDREKFGVFLGGRAARTRYKVIEKNNQYSLLEVTPESGRTHQIRVHLKYIGHPVVGDKKYAGRKTAREDRRWCPRQFLHASYLSFVHPQTGKKLRFSSRLPIGLKTIVDKIFSK